MLHVKAIKTHKFIRPKIFHSIRIAEWYVFNKSITYAYLLFIQSDARHRDGLAASANAGAVVVIVMIFKNWKIPIIFVWQVLIGTVWYVNDICKLWLWYACKIIRIWLQIFEWNEKHRPYIYIGTICISIGMCNNLHNIFFCVWWNSL